MADREVERRLAAILAADVAGYTRLMEKDSDGTVAAWQAARVDVIRPNALAHSGKLVKLTGDGFLIEFPTVLDAVNCAISMQEGLVSSALNFRMGVNLGDIIDDGEDIHGEGVNIAARIEALADEGGISISGSIFEQVRNRINATYEDRGEHEVKNVSAPVRVYAILLNTEPAMATFSGRDASTEATGDDCSKTATQQRKINLAFDGLELSGSGEQAELLCDGVNQAILAALANQAGLSLRTDSEKADMLVEGTMQAVGTRYRVAIRLLDKKNDELIKAEKFDGVIADLFEAEDDLGLRICTSIRFGAFSYEASVLEKSDLPMEEQESGIIRVHVGGLLSGLMLEEWLEARRLLKIVLERDAEDHSALAMAGMASMVETQCGWRSPAPEDRVQGIQFLREAVRLNPQGDFAHAMLCTALLDLDEDPAAALFTAEQSLSIAPHYAQGQMAYAAAMIYVGQVDEGVSLALKAIEPIKGLRLFAANAAHLMLGLLLSKRHDEVLTWGRMVDQRERNVPRILVPMISAAAHLQDHDLARDHAARLLKLCNDFTLGEMRTWPLKRDGDWDHVMQGLRSAGLPD